MISNSYYGSPQQVLLLANVTAAEEVLEEGFALNRLGHRDLDEESLLKA